MQDIIHAIGFIMVFGALFAAVIVAEALYCRRRGQQGVYLLPDTLSNMFMGFNYKIVDGIAVALVIRAGYDWIYPLGLQYQPVHGVWSVLLIFLISDLAFWIMHFSMHKVRWFWTSHVTHHSSPRMNYSTALRQNFTMVFNGVWLLWWVPIALVGFDKNWATIAIELNLAYQFFLHTQQPSWLDRLGSVLNTPSHHRVHHGCNPRQIDTNFGGVLIVWDRLFGTFVPESAAGPIRFGITERQPESLNPVYLQLHGWGEMFADLWRSRDWRVLVKDPTWLSRQQPSSGPDAPVLAKAPSS